MSLIARPLAITVLILASSVTGVTNADPLPKQFTLGKYIPDDVWIYLHGAKNPERDWLQQHWSEVFEALKSTGLDRDIADLTSRLWGDPEKETTTASIEKWTRLLNHVDWKALPAQEYAYAQRVATLPGAYDYFILTRGKPGSGDKNAEALVTLLHALSDLCNDITVTPNERNGIKSWSLTSGERGIKNLGFSIELIHKDDMIAVTTGIKARNEVMALMAGQKKKHSVVRTSRFHEAMKQVERPEDFLSFVDIRRIFKDLSSLMGAAAKTREKAKTADSPKLLSAIMKGMERCDVMDYVVSTSQTRGRMEIHDEVAKLQPSKSKCAVACCGLDRKPFAQFDRFIPAEATGFSLSGSLNLEATYGVITEFIALELPDGQEYLDKFHMWLSTLGFDLDRDLFSWWSGELIQIALPATVVTPIGGGQDSVLMIRVQDEALAKKKVDAFLQFVSRAMQSQGQSLMISAAEVDQGGFKQVVHPFLAMAVRPVIGVHGDWLIIGSSSTAVNKCLMVASGKAPSITRNGRFAKEGLTPKGPVMAASFTDTSQFGEQLAGTLGMVGVIGGMASSMIQGEEAAQARQLLQKLLQMVTKLGPVARELDFFSSESSVTTYDGASILRTARVVHYKPDPEVEKTATRR